MTPVKQQVKYQLWNQVRRQVDDQINGKVWTQARNQVRDQVHNKARELIKSKMQ